MDTCPLLADPPLYFVALFLLGPDYSMWTPAWPSSCPPCSGTVASCLFPLCAQAGLDQRSQAQRTSVRPQSPGSLLRWHPGTTDGSGSDRPIHHPYQLVEVSLMEEACFLGNINLGNVFINLTILSWKMFCWKIFQLTDFFFKKMLKCKNCRSTQLTSLSKWTF